jgi:hypothetical protein
VNRNNKVIEPEEGRDQGLAESGEAEEAGRAPVLDLALVVSDRTVARDLATHPARLQMLVRRIYFSTPLSLRSAVAKVCMTIIYAFPS